MGLSLRAYARHRGVSDSTVRKAIKTGRIRQQADGSIDPEQADRDWANHTRSPAFEPSAKDQAAAETSIDIDSPNTTSTSTSASSTSKEDQAFHKARLSNEVLKAQRQRLKLDEEKGKLIDRDKVLAHVFQLGRSERDAWLHWPTRIASQFAAEFDLDPQQVHRSLDNHVREHLLELAELQLQPR
jgi:hypothetical protein